MAKHEFGIMRDAPSPGKRYDKYEPWKYSCISVDDDFLCGVISRLDPVDFYWHTLSVREKGLAYCGVTLIPPSSLGAFIEAVGGLPGLSALRELLEKAQDADKWVIHYGL